MVFKRLVTELTRFLLIGSLFVDHIGRFVYFPGNNKGAHKVDEGVHQYDVNKEALFKPSRCDGNEDDGFCADDVDAYDAVTYRWPQNDPNKAKQGCAAQKEGGN